MGSLGALIALAAPVGNQGATTGSAPSLSATGVVLTAQPSFSMTIVEVAAPRWNLNGVDYTPKIDTNAGGNNITTAAAGNTLYQQTVAPQSSQNTTVAYVTSSTTPEPWAPTRPWQYRSSWSAQESEVPEPNEMLLMGLGLVAVALVGRRRSKTPSANRTVN